MRSRRPVPWGRSTWVRVAGYGGAALLAAAAVAVLLLPLLDGGTGGAGTAGAQTSASPSAQEAGVPGVPSAPGDPAPRQTRGGRAYPGEQGGGPPIPEQNGSSGLSPCPRGAASYRAAPDGVDVVVAVSSSGAIRAELSLRGGAAPSQQTTVKGGGPHTFHFRGVAPGLVQRVKVTTVSLGIAMQSCYARAAA